MGDVISIFVHAIVLFFGIFGIGVSVVFVNALLFVGSMITLGAVSYSLFKIVMVLLNRRPTPVP